MYYKIENKKCDVYKKLHKLRTEELQMAKDNIAAIEKKTGLKFKTFLGHPGQQNFRRVPQYDGFKFINPKKVDPKIWKPDTEHPEIFVPNRKTKLGREMSEFLLNGLKGSCYFEIFDILKLPDLRRFTIPFVEISGKRILIYLDNRHEPKDKNVIEITKREFNELLK